jgi:serine protease Do
MRATDIFDQYLEGKISSADKAKFEAQLRTDNVFSNAFNEHKQLLASLEKHEGREELKKKLKAIHEKEFGINSRVISIHREETFARKHGRTIAVAASTALIAVLSTVAILSTGGYLLKQQSNQITDLNRKVMELHATNNAVIEAITAGNKTVAYAPANYEGTAFALNNKGYVLTSFHMVNGADSIFIQNGQTDRTSAKLVFCDPKLDMAVLRVENKDLIKNWQIPFALKEKVSDVGEKVFTLGYPRKDMVYGEGALSSLSGYSNDTSMYQISIPVNPGNSGGPLLDENGFVIGVIRGKISGAEATGFAIKSQQILNSINATAADSIKHDFASTNVKKSGLRNLKRPDQVRKINPYVFNVLIYKKD